MMVVLIFSGAMIIAELVMFPSCLPHTHKKTHAIVFAHTHTRARAHTHTDIPINQVLISQNVNEFYFKLIILFK
jgi:hypothetical protein